MGFFHQNGETELLIKKKPTTKRSAKQLVKWIIIMILLSALLISTIYLVYIIFFKKSLPELSEKIKQQNPLHISSIATTNGDYLKQCAPRVQCDPNAKYRSINGSCNNLEIPTWGASNTPFLRLLNANYSDGFYKLREQANGSALPNVRLLNIELFMAREKYRVDENNVLMVPFGQLLAHDLTGMLTDNLISPQGVSTDCCLDKEARKLMPQCAVTYDIPPDDPVYSKHGLNCQSKYRLLTSRNDSCLLTPTTFININSHFMDASDIYGSSEDVSLNIRTMESGKLNFSTNDDGQMFCPYQAETEGLPDGIKFQYDSGDSKGLNQNIGITAMSTLFLRFHNYIASRLLALNSFWSDEVVYQESRRIVIGIIQRTAYEEFLPIIIGKDYQELYGINEENIYDSTINPSASQEWSTAAFRVLHTLIPVQFNLVNNNYTIESSVVLTDWMPDPQLLPINNNFNKLFKGFLETAGRMTQPSYNFFISNYMFHGHNDPPYKGFDLLSGDILAGRDVGLQPYNQIRKLCGIPLAENFEDLLDLIHLHDINKLKEHYHTVDDIDLIVGLLLEKPSDGAIVGPTSQCLIADNFYRIKAADRFFYDVTGQPSSFTSDQLKTIKKITLGHVLCASTNVDHVQTEIFKIVDPKLFSTSKLECDDNFYIDLSAWKYTPNKAEM